MMSQVPSGPQLQQGAEGTAGGGGEGQAAQMGYDNCEFGVSACICKCVCVCVCV